MPNEGVFSAAPQEIDFFSLGGRYAGSRLVDPIQLGHRSNVVILDRLKSNRQRLIIHAVAAELLLKATDVLFFRVARLPRYASQIVNLHATDRQFAARFGLDVVVKGKPECIVAG